jgi:hypothetical protein
MLVLDLTERKTGRLVWRATSKKRVTGKDVTDKSLARATGHVGPVSSLAPCSRTAAGV